MKVAEVWAWKPFDSRAESPRTVHTALGVQDEAVLEGETRISQVPALRVILEPGYRLVLYAEKSPAALIADLAGAASG